MASEYALETRNVNKRFGGVVAANNVDLKVEPGELRCIIGPNGAGKSTLFSLLCGIQRADSGEIYINGHDVTRMQPYRRVRHGIGLTFQTNRAYQELSVKHNLMVPNPSLAVSKKSHQQGQERLVLALEEFGLDPNDDTLASEIPHHTLQWLEISMMLAGFPNLVLIDEPTAGMSREETDRTSMVLKKLNGNGLTIIVVEHDMHFVKSIAKKVTVLHQGRIFTEGNLDEVIANEEVKKIYLGHAH
ncbi:MAG: ATP-binding cassette domain-containing protein [Gammaproteobacteria bacterium]|nr:MAG: ATP-binding cassette domain-containing protein [Gammaproteobacteria bacterium]